MELFGTLNSHVKINITLEIEKKGTLAFLDALVEF